MILKSFGESLGVFRSLLAELLFEVIRESFLKSDGFSGNNVLEWAALGTWKDCAVDENRDVFEMCSGFF